ncbi:MAG: TetR family transcriptional regulator [Sporomusaceae bacterium]|nr:TetR family transcriptional regulator [Sporomusaceae bacterium]
MKIDVPVDKPAVCKIIQAAIPLFATKGLRAVSVKELAEAAGVNVAMISYYFGGKENLYTFVLENQLAIFDETLAVIQREETCPVAKIRRMALAITSIHKDNPYLDHLFYREVANPTQWCERFVLTAGHRLNSFLRACISEAIAAGQFRKELQPDLASIALIKLLNLTFLARFLNEKTLPSVQDPVEAYVTQSIEIYLRGVALAPEL